VDRLACQAFSISIFHSLAAASSFIQ